MNIFVTSPNPRFAAQTLPDKHIVKMPLETCQMLSIVASKKWGYNFGTLPKLDGTPYNTEKGAFRNHPCTIWAQTNWSWLIQHGLELCAEYTHRYNKIHSCQHTMEHAVEIFPQQDSDPTDFVFAGPDVFKHDKNIGIFTAYKRYIASKPWAASNYLRDPSRKPHWL